MAEETITLATDCLLTCLLRLVGKCAVAPLPQAAALLAVIKETAAVLHLSVGAASLMIEQEAPGSTQAPTLLLSRVCEAGAALCAAMETAVPAGTLSSALYLEALNLPSLVTKCVCTILERQNRRRCASPFLLPRQPSVTLFHRMHNAMYTLAWSVNNPLSADVHRLVHTECSFPPQLT